MTSASGAAYCAAGRRPELRLHQRRLPRRQRGRCVSRPSPRRLDAEPSGISDPHANFISPGNPISMTRGIGVPSRRPRCETRDGPRARASSGAPPLGLRREARRRLILAVRRQPGGCARDVGEVAKAESAARGDSSIQYRPRRRGEGAPSQPRSQHENTDAVAMPMISW